MSIIEFLSSDLHSLGKTRDDISNRLINALTNNGANTLFTALRFSEAELLDTPNVGRKTISDLKSILAPYNISLGATAEFYEANKEFFSYTKPIDPQYAKYPGQTYTREKAITDTATEDCEFLFIGDLQAKIRQFLENFEIKGPGINTVQPSYDLKWVEERLPEKWRKALTPSFMSAAINEASALPEIKPHAQAICEIIVDNYKEHLSGTNLLDINIEGAKNPPKELKWLTHFLPDFWKDAITPQFRNAALNLLVTDPNVVSRLDKIKDIAVNHIKQSLALD